MYALCILLGACVTRKKGLKENNGVTLLAIKLSCHFSSADPKSNTPRYLYMLQAAPQFFFASIFKDVLITVAKN